MSSNRSVEVSSRMPFLGRVLEKVILLVPHRVRLLAYHFLPAHFVVRKLWNTIVPPGSAVMRLRVGALKGYTVEVDPRIEASWLLGTHEPAVGTALQALLQPGDTAYDIGAHKGYFSLLMARCGAQGKVFAFEPDPDNYRVLNKNIALNKVNNVIAMSLAVSDSIGVASFARGPLHERYQGHVVDRRAGHSHPDEGRGHCENPGPARDTITVKTVTLDHLAYEKNLPLPDLIKIDVEGHESQVLAGARCLLARARPLVLCEIHNHTTAEEVWKILCEFGYLVFDVERNCAMINRVEDMPPRDVPWTEHIVASHKESGRRF